MLKESKNKLENRIDIASNMDELLEGLDVIGQNWIIGGGVTSDGLSKWQQEIINKAENDREFNREYSPHPSSTLYHGVEELYGRDWGEAEVERMSALIDALANVYSNLCGKSE